MNFFDFVDSKTSSKTPNSSPNGDEEGTSISRKGSVHQRAFDSDVIHPRKPIGSKRVFGIKYKSTGEIERYKARLVAKGFNQREGIDYEETFSHVFKMGTMKCFISLVVQKDWKSYQMSVSGYCVFVNGCLVSWKSKSHATLSKPSTEAEYRAMASGTCKVMWVLKVLKDLGLKDLVPITLFCDNKSVIHIAANSMMHEIIKNFDIYVHFVRENVALVKIEEEDAALALFVSFPPSFENFDSSFVVGKDTITLEDIRSSLHSRELRQ
uniref:Ribonuclease H-like domain-containing protein n=1 Tax=Tanacetum cinerariifolium TaxID=118510 RepID=A0A6L2NVC9_TANCI|nr:ribonuclease H-like domain-containing protein [Tanacetum cinerariifolium]